MLLMAMKYSIAGPALQNSGPVLEKVSVLCFVSNPGSMV